MRHTHLLAHRDRLARSALIAGAAALALLAGCDRIAPPTERPGAAPGAAASNAAVNAAANVPASFPDIYGRVAPAVVSINAATVTAAPAPITDIPLFGPRR